MRRREFIAGIGGVALPILPKSAVAQQTALPLIAVLGSASHSNVADLLPHFNEGLAESRILPGENALIEMHWAEGRYDRLPTMAGDLARREVSLIFAVGDSAWAAKAATSIIPIVFANGSDPVETGLVASLSHPAGNVTGASWTSNPLTPKRLEILRDLVPRMTTVGAIVNPANPSAAIDIRALRTATTQLQFNLELVTASTSDELAAAFNSLAQLKVDAVMVGADSFFVSRRMALITMAARSGLPSMWSTNEYVKSGGLISYAPRRSDAFKVAGTYAGRILKGMKPADLPVQLPSRFELLINLKAAKAIGLAVPPMLLARADEVIE